MDFNDSSSDTPLASANAKKPYEKPSFRYENVFVTTALSCGKVHPTQGGCQGVNAQAS
jgi:hypothetical protein